MKLLVVINPFAGEGKGLRMTAKIKKLLSLCPHDFAYCVSQSPTEMRQAISDAYAGQFDGVLLTGGDGTLHEALDTIAQSGFVCGILPCGRGNDFARNIGIPKDLKSNCSLPRTPIISVIDLPYINGIPFASVACVGFDAYVNRLARDKKGIFGGTLGYIICVFRALWSFKPFDIELEVDSYTWSGPVVMVSIANGKYYGAGMKIAPDALIDDGILNVCVVKKASRGEIIRHFPGIFKGRHVQSSKVMMLRGKVIRIKANEPKEIFADGEYICSLPADCTIEHRKLKIIKVIDSKDEP